MRKLATIRTIAEIKNIQNADLIQAYRIDGWWVVSNKDEFTVGDKVIYIEIDSWVPTKIAPFLSKGNEPRTYNGVQGERLRTIKLKGQLSQGLILPVTILQNNTYNEGDDVTELLGIQKWEMPIVGNLIVGNLNAKGNFPSFFPKTDQERIQNLASELGNYVENGSWSKYEEWEEEPILAFVDNDKLVTNYNWQQSIEFWEITEKLDGSSMTVYYHNNEFGVCSRNFELKLDIPNQFTDTVKKYNLEEILRKYGKNIAIQGELVGPNIQGNKYKLNDYRFYIFDIFDIDTQTYLNSFKRTMLIDSLNKLVSDCLKLESVPMIDIITNKDIEVYYDNVLPILTLAEGKSELNKDTEREGVVFKCVNNPSISFKAISNKFLLKN